MINSADCKHRPAECKHNPAVDDMMKCQSLVVARMQTSHVKNILSEEIIDALKTDEKR